MATQVKTNQMATHVVGVGELVRLVNMSKCTWENENLESG